MILTNVANPAAPRLGAVGTVYLYSIAMALCCCQYLTRRVHNAPSLAHASAARAR
ncbi:hypothetical protein CBM2631_A90171 [Cupriavidus taiwanensis]|nr:hypothetical protein CBM2617_A70150 [Cupriavidus taiwanensis]SOZ82641.1 hypothetical protein CBM2618_A80150 [Cupriavidus taiwanensis]SOZ84471.1 hypothetical protein CBM2622_A80150 [Cupriavidus taiwanensis]SOZ92214.1 hypothetical protein CBM2621_A80149 [Cupriavidus taiwanensis]SPA17095.1 hypothetical protein CBM2631_A90171 [Cupriavidus taiwanensis]